MFDIAGTELLLIIILAIVFVGPKELPRLMRAVGGFVRKARMVVRDFQQSFEDLANQADLDGIRREAGEAKREAENFIHRPVEPAQSPPEKDEGGAQGEKKKPKPKRKRKGKA